MLVVVESLGVGMAKQGPRQSPHPFKAPPPHPQDGVGLLPPGGVYKGQAVTRGTRKGRKVVWVLYEGARNGAETFAVVLNLV